MHRFFEKYPKEFKVIILIYTLQQYIYSGLVDYAQTIEVLEWFITDYNLVNGFTLIVGGFLANSYANFRLKLRNSMFGIVLGGVLIATESAVESLLGVFIFQISSCIFFISIFIRVGKYIHAINNAKTNSFFLISFFFSLLFIPMFAVELIFAQFNFYEGKLILIGLSIISALWLIGKLELSEIPIPKQGQKNPKFIYIFIGFTILSIVYSFGLDLASTLKPEGLVPIPILVFLFLVFFIFCVGGLYWIFGKKEKEEIDIIKILCLGLVISGFTYFINILFFQILFLSTTFLLTYFIYEVIFIPIFMTILTHNYLERQKGIILGLFFGLTFFSKFFVEKYITLANYQEAFMIMVAISLLIIPPIIKNQERLKEVLRINLPQEIEPMEEKLEDPFDHLIEE